MLKRQTTLLRLLDKVSSLPNELSGLVSSESYASMLMSGSLCWRPEAAAAFLRQLAGAVRALAKTETEALEEMQCRQRGTRREASSYGGPADAAVGESSGGLDGWDLEGLLSMATGQSWGGQGREAASWSDFSSYFTLASLVEVSICVIGRDLSALRVMRGSLPLCTIPIIIIKKRSTQ